ncbi:MAG TPA: hypothetical protein VMR37_00925 [Rhabdochlamydiaceae bacterium]|nr:hypothetical protein [Rhabdochlamydiaceae bacterium]
MLAKAGNIILIALRWLKKIVSEPMVVYIAIFLVGGYVSFLSVESLSISTKIQSISDNIQITSGKIQDLQFEALVLQNGAAGFASKNDSMNIVSALVGTNVFSLGKPGISLIQNFYSSYINLEEEVGLIPQLNSKDLATALNIIQTPADYYKNVKLSTLDLANKDIDDIHAQVGSFESQENTAQDNQDALIDQQSKLAQRAILWQLLTTPTQVLLIRAVVIQGMRYFG